MTTVNTLLQTAECSEIIVFKNIKHYGYLFKIYFNFMPIYSTDKNTRKNSKNSSMQTFFCPANMNEHDDLVVTRLTNLKTFLIRFLSVRIIRC